MPRLLRVLLTASACVMVAAALALRAHSPAHWIIYLLLACAVLCLGAALVRFPSASPVSSRAFSESDDIAAIGDARHRELIRGTSLHLRNMKYRYSVRPDQTRTSDRRCFTAEVNGVRLGFVPVIVTDNSSDRQGFGYVAFVYDDERWRGPGLPCPDGQPNAVRHAARCVTPLAKQEESCS